MEEEEERGPLFDGVVFTIIPSEDVTDEQTADLLETLVDEGAKYLPLDANSRIENTEALTHIISTHVNFSQYTESLDLGVDVVKPSWVITSVRRGRITNARPHSPDPSQYFSDLVVSSADIPESDKESIRTGVVTLGGQWSGPLTKIVTHIVTTSLDHDKCRAVQQQNLKCKIVLPHWFDVCLKLGKKIREEPYMFPDPDILNTEIDKQPRASPSPFLEGASTDKPLQPPAADSPSSSPSRLRKDLNAFMSRKVFISQDLELSNNLHATLETLIRYGGGTLTLDAAVADVYVGMYRDGTGYVNASRAGKEVASLAWLYSVIQKNRWTNPLHRPLHYPVPRNGIKGFENMIISVSNYSGESRIYLENLIKHCGGAFTKTMKPENTHLITAHKRSEKVAAAEEWNINVINHLWLEESYAKCAVQVVANPRYTVFPTRTNLGEICGQTPLDIKRMEFLYFPKAIPQKQAPRNPSPRKTISATVPASSVMTARPSASLEADEMANMPTQITEDDDIEIEEPQPVKKPRGRPSKSAVATPRPAVDGKENESPLTLSTGRASKIKAMGALTTAAEDMNQFSKEQKRKGGVTHGGRRSTQAAENFSSPAPANAPAAAAKKSKKRPSEENTYDVTAQGSDLSDGETQKLTAKPSKKAKTSRTSGDSLASFPPVEHRMMVTGDERWVGKAKQEDTDKSKLRQLGVLLTQDPKEVTILVAKGILRTPKFVCALASAPQVVELKYLDVALKQNKLIDNPDTLSDRDAEERMGFKLKDALGRAKINNRKLLRGWNIFVSRDIAGTFETFKTIITINGGNAFAFAGRTGMPIEGRDADDSDAGPEKQHQGGDDEYGFVYLVSGVTASEQKQWKNFRDQVRKHGLEPRIVKSDWLLNAAMRQEVTWNQTWELEEGAK